MAAPTKPGDSPVATEDAQAPAKKPVDPNTTIPQGRYLVNGVLVDAEGRPATPLD